jgi:hypothetical protein
MKLAYVTAPRRIEHDAIVATKPRERRLVPIHRQNRTRAVKSANHTKITQGRAQLFGSTPSHHTLCAVTYKTSHPAPSRKSP